MKDDKPGGSDGPAATARRMTQDAAMLWLTEDTAAAVGQAVSASITRWYRTACRALWGEDFMDSREGGRRGPGTRSTATAWLDPG